MYTLITGAGSGIGRCLAHEFASKGRLLALVDIDRNSLRELAKELRRKYHILVHTKVQDLCENDAADKIFKWCENREINIEILVNNAGIGHTGAFVESKDGLYRNMISLNIGTLVRLSKLFATAWKNKRGRRIVNMASMASFFPVSYKSVYAASKAFVLNFSLSLRQELRKQGIKVSCICPGAVYTSKIVLDRIKKGGWVHSIFAISAEKLASIVVPKLLRGQAVIVPSPWSGVVRRIGSLIPAVLLTFITSKIFS